MKIEVEGKIAIEDNVKMLVYEVLEAREAKGFKNPNFDVFVLRYLGSPALSAPNVLSLSALDIIALTISDENKKNIANELNAFQEMMLWSKNLGIDIQTMGGLLSLGKEERSKRIKQSVAKETPADQIDKVLTKLDELESHLSKIDKMITTYFPKKGNKTTSLVIHEMIEQIQFGNNNTAAKRLIETKKKSGELLLTLIQAKPEQKQIISIEKGKTDSEMLRLFVELEPKKEIRSKLIAWIFAEDSWTKLRDEKYLWTLLARMSNVATRYSNVNWAFMPGQTNILDLIINAKWPKYINKQEIMDNSAKAAKKLASYPVGEVSKQIIFDPFKVDWGIAQEIMYEFETNRVKLYQNCMETYSETLKELLKHYK